MKKIVLIVLCNVLFCSFLLKCMEDRSVQVGAFAYASQGKKQNARYDIKRLGDSVGIGLFDGYNGKAVAWWLKQELFDDTAYFLINEKYTNQNYSVKKFLKVGLRIADLNIRDTEDGDPMDSQASTVIASWVDLTSRKGNLLLLGDSIACLIGNKPVSMTSPQWPLQFVGAKILKKDAANYYLTPKSYSYTIEDDYDYLILATYGVYDVLDVENEESDFKKIFFDIVSGSKEEFNQLYPLPHGIQMESEEGSDSEDDFELRRGLQGVVQDDAMIVIAKKLVQVALSRGSNKNITVIVQSLKKKE